MRADPVVWTPWQVELASGAAATVERSLATEVPDRFVHVLHTIPAGLRRHPGAEHAVARTMYESDRLPVEWVARCNSLDEVWVPSEFNVETFARSGVDRARLVKVPEPIRAELYRRVAKPLQVHGAAGFVFLCVSNWSRRKGWDVLVRAYTEEFTPAEDVTLVFAVPPAAATMARLQLDRFMRETLELAPDRSPRIVLQPCFLSDVDMPRLYRSAGAYVMPSRGEGWGRPYMEAMACGVPTIGTRWSGNLEFMDDGNAFLVDCRVVEVGPESWGELDRFTGHRWAEPSVGHLRELLRRVTVDRREAARRARRGRAEVLDRLRADRVAAAMVERLEASGLLLARCPARRSRRIAVVWDGTDPAAGVRGGGDEMLRALTATGRVEVRPGCDPAGPTAPIAPPAVQVRTLGAPADVPPAARLVLRLPSAVEGAPAGWVEQVDGRVDEVWVPSRYDREVCVRLGADPGRVAVVPAGVDPLRFHPSVPPMWLPTRRRFRFLLAGRLVPGGGAGSAVRAYLEAFGPDDDVCLVVWDPASAGEPHPDAGLRDQLLRLQDEPGVAEVRYLGAALPADAPARLYAACHCLVAPDPAASSPGAAEAMACGLPAVLPPVGAHLEYSDQETAYFAEPAALAATMRHVFERPGEAQERGRRAGAAIRRRSTWARAADTAVARLERLGGRTPPRPAGRAGAAPLSVCIIARDEEAVIGACVSSVRGVAAQVVVVDTGSVDRTARIARSRGAEVYGCRWTDDFAAARNESLRHARHPWVLVLDADEELDPASHDEIRSLTAGPAAAYLVRMRNYTEPEGRATWVEHLNLRLFPNDARFGYTARDPHARLVALTPDAGLEMRGCDVVIHHEGYRPQVFDERGKARRNLEALERAVRDRPGDAFSAYNLGRSYSQLGRSGDAERLLALAIDLGRPGPGGGYPDFLLSAHLSLAVNLVRMGRHDEAAAWCHRALAHAPDFADVHVTLAAARASLGDLDGALAAYGRALACAGRPSGVATDTAASGWKALLGMAEVHLLRGATADAVACAERAGALVPGHPAVAEFLERAREAG